MVNYFETQKKDLIIRVNDILKVELYESSREKDKFAMEILTDKIRSVVFYSTEKGREDDYLRLRDLLFCKNIEE